MNLSLLILVSFLSLSITTSERVVLRPEDFGAKGDGSHNDTAALIETIGRCQQEGGCEILLSSGKDIFDWTTTTYQSFNVEC